MEVDSPDLEMLYNRTMSRQSVVLTRGTICIFSYEEDDPLFPGNHGKILINNSTEN